MRSDEFAAVIARDHREHEVDARLAARARRAVAVDFEDLLRDDRALELLGELLIRLPVHRDAILRSSCPAIASHHTPW